jgi:riboflavin transporter FmnP
MTAVFVSVVVSLLEMITISSTGVIGFIMNVISTCAFACTAAYIYKKHQTAKGALAGLITASLAMTAVMLLWNYLITPIYMNYPRQAVVKLLLPAFLPFNLLKSGINTALVLILYKPVVAALRQTKMISEGQVKTEKKINAGVAFFSVFVLITCVLVVMVMNKTI